MANFFITGSTGFIGGHLVRRLLDGNHTLWCLVHRRDPDVPYIPGVRWVEGDLCDPRSYEYAVKTADAVIHLAGRIHARKRDEYFQTNVVGTDLLLKVCRNAPSLKRFVHMSSIAVMGPSVDGRLLKESDSCNPQSEYGKSKWMAEQKVLEVSPSIPTVILRPAFVYGRGDLRGLNVLQSHVQSGSSVWARTIGTFSLCHVSDVVESCVLSVEKRVPSGEIYIVSSPEILTTSRMTEVLNRLFQEFFPGLFTEGNGFFFPPKPAERPDFGNNKNGNHHSWGCDTCKAEKELDFHPKMIFEAGARDTIRWYMDEGLFQLGRPNLGKDQRSC